jgi:hypothetical protein
VGRKSKGKIGNRGYKLTRGIGINDADYPVFLRLEDGKVWHCPIYRHWSNMLTRCTSEDGKYSYEYADNHNSTYVGVSLCDEWIPFMQFREWVLTQDWEGKSLDKDLLGDGTFYSPTTCCFVPQVINMCIHKTSKKYLWGVRLSHKKYSSSVSCDGAILYPQLSFNTELEAHQYWQKGKIEALKYLANKYYSLGQISKAVYDELLLKSGRIEQDLINGVPTYTLKNK